jgi:hypothetical protein
MIRISFLTSLNPRIGSLLLFSVVFVSRGEKDVISPTPPHKLAQLLKDKQVENSTGGHFVVVVVRYLVPMKSR